MVEDHRAVAELQEIFEMKKYLFILVAMMTTLFSINALAFNPPAPPANGWYVLDQAGKLTTSQLNTINKKILATSQATKNEFGVLILSSMDGDNIEDVAGTTFRAWGIGKHGLDNGVLLVISSGDRKTRIETGKGVEGEVTDLQASDILNRDLKPSLKRGDYATGIVATLDSLDRLLESRHNAKVIPVVKDVPPAVVAPAVSATNDSTPSTHNILFVVLGFFALLGFGFIIWTIFVSYQEDDRREELEQIKNSQKRNAATRERLEREARAQQDRAVEAVALRNTVQHTQPISNPVDTRAASQVAAASAASELEQMRLQNERNKERREQERRRQRELEREQEREDDRRAAIAAAAAAVVASTFSSDDDDDDDSSSSSGSTFSIPDFGGDDNDGGGFGGGDSGGGGASGDF